MHRTWVITPAVVAAVLAAQVGGTTPSDSQAAVELAVDTALAQADAAIDWQCAMPHRDSSRRAARSIAAGSVLPFAEDASIDSGAVPGPGGGSGGSGGGPGQLATAEGAAKTIPGFGTGPGDKPATQVTGTLSGPDTSDVYAIPLRAGDVFSATVRGTGGTLEVRDPNGVLVEGSSIDRSGIYPEASPLLGGGNATVDHVAGAAGTYTLTIRRAKAGAAVGGTSPLPSASSAPASSGPSTSGPAAFGPAVSGPTASGPRVPAEKPSNGGQPSAPADEGDSDTSSPTTTDSGPDQAQVVQQVPYPAAPLAANSLTPTQQAVPPDLPGSPSPGTLAPGTTAPGGAPAGTAPGAPAGIAPGAPAPVGAAPAPAPGAPAPGGAAPAPAPGAPTPGAPAPGTPPAAAQPVGTHPAPATPAGTRPSAGPRLASANPAAAANPAPPATPTAPGAPASPGNPANPAAPNPAAPIPAAPNAAGPADTGPTILPPAAVTAAAPAAGAAGPSGPGSPTNGADPSSTDPGALAPDPDAGAPDPSTGALPAATAATIPVSPAPAPGTYQADLGIFRPPANAAPQKIVLEFGGATVEPKKFGIESATTPAQAKLSPLSSFMTGFGLSPADQPALMAKVADTFRQNMSDALGGGQVDVTVAATPAESTFGQPDVSRVVIGGSTKEAGISTVGISESVDPGNFVREETALVLLDRLAGPSNQTVSLTHYLPGTVTEQAKIEFVGRALGNIASHEAGHFLGSWHTDAASPKHDLMAPGDVVGAFGFGADKIGGTRDDVRTHFGQDTFSPQEGFTGTEDTKTRTAVGLRGGTNPS